MSEALIFGRTWGEHVVYMNCSDCQNQFLYTTCSLHVLQKEEELLTKIYPYSLTQEAIDGNVRLEDKKLFIPADLSINTPVLNLFYNKSEYKLDLHSQILCSFHWITGN